MGVGQGEGICFAFFHEFESSLVQEFEFFWEFSLFQEFCKIREMAFHDCCLGTANWLSDGEKNCIEYSLFGVFIIIIIIIIIGSSSSIYIVVL